MRLSLKNTVFCAVTQCSPVEVHFYQTICCLIIDDSAFHSHYCENLKPMGLSVFVCQVSLLILFVYLFLYVEKLDLEIWSTLNR
jgi:hypothetical protein